MKTSNFFAVIVAVFLLAACGDNNKGYDASGVFEATEVLVSADGNGTLMQFDVLEGQKVVAGERLGLIDTVQLYLKKRQLQANAGATLSRQLNVSRQIASLQEQIATQKREKHRFEQLVSQSAANQKQVDDIVAQIATLEKQVAAQTETLNSSNSSLSDEQKALIAQIAQIDDQIRKCVITSPIDGTILTKYAEAGELASIGRSLFKVADIENLFLRAYVSAGQLTSIKRGQSVTIFSDRGEDGRQEHEGTITWISDKAEFTPKTIQTRDERANLVYAVKMAVHNDGYIKIGMYGEVKF